jgi:hypothetical protein
MENTDEKAKYRNRIIKIIKAYETFCNKSKFTDDEKKDVLTLLDNYTDNELMNKENNNDFNIEKNKDTAEKMSDDEKMFSFFNNSFCYKKISNSSDSLLSKLIEKIDKEEKKKIDINMKEKIKVIDYNTENLIENMEE